MWCYKCGAKGISALCDPCYQAYRTWMHWNCMWKGGGDRVEEEDRPPRLPPPTPRIVQLRADIRNVLLSLMPPFDEDRHVPGWMRHKGGGSAGGPNDIDANGGWANAVRVFEDNRVE